MSFFDALRRVLHHESRRQASDEARRRIRSAWGLEDDEAVEPAAAPAPPVGGQVASDYDRSQWAKRLRRILEELPASQTQWHDLVTDAQALRLEPGWVSDRYREEFDFVVRRAVADRVVSEEEHRKIDLARKLIGMPEPEAERVLSSITAEAESFFGTPVRDES